MCRLVSFLAFALSLSYSSAIPTASSPAPLSANVYQRPPHRLVRRDDTSISTRNFFLELPTKPVIQGGSLSAILAEQQALKDSLTAKGIRFQTRFSFSGVVNALSLDLLEDSSNPDAQFREVEGLKAVWPMIVFSMPAAPTGGFDQVFSGQNSNLPVMSSAVNMTGVRLLHNQGKYFGQGIKVGVIDSGIDYKHTALGGCFGPSCKVAYGFDVSLWPTGICLTLGFGALCKVAHGFDFVGDSYSASSSDPSKNIPHPRSDPMDCGGHGTHVAGIIAANNSQVVGVAPGATLGAYRVFGCDGSTSSDVIVAAMERAWNDGMDVINLSLGGGSSWPEYPTSVAGTRLTEAGMVVVAAMGNDGAVGLWEASSPAVGDGVIAVASIDNSFYLGKTLNVSSDPTRTMGFTNADEKPENPLGVFVGNLSASTLDTQVSTDGCQAYVDRPDINGTVLLIRRGVCNFEAKVVNAQAAGAIGVLMYNNDFGQLSYTFENNNVTIPYFGIQQQDGEYLISQLKNNVTVTATFGSEMKLLGNPSGGLISSFSSWGLGPTLQIKPTISAPGGLIYSTYPKEQYKTMSGTSMATPHMVGCVALLIQARGRTPVKLLTEIFQNSAQFSLTPSSSIAHSVARQGAGIVQVQDAIALKTHVTPSSLALKESPLIGNTKTVTFQVTNWNTKTQAYSLTHTPSVSIGSATASKPNFSAYASSVFFPQSSFTLGPGESKRVFAFITPSVELEAKDGYIYSGFILVRPEAGKPVSVPYAGYKGRFRDKVAIANITALPYIRRSPQTEAFGYENQTAVFNLRAQKLTFVYRLEQPSPSITLTLREAGSKKVVGTIDTLKQLGRNSEGSNTVSQYNWDGKIVKKGWFWQTPKRVDVPNGDYRMGMQVEKAAGGWWTRIPLPWLKRYESWTSCTIQLRNEEVPTATATSTATATATSTATPLPAPFIMDTVDGPEARVTPTPTP